MTTTVGLVTATGTNLATLTTATSAPQMTAQLTYHAPAAIDACTTIPPRALRRATILREVTA